MTDALDTMDITELLVAVQNSLDSSMKSIQTAIMQLETTEPTVSDTLAALRDTHRLLFYLDLVIVKAVNRGEVAL
ncbi:MAG: hypothetical protein K2O18_10490 [Oscillospiraceae bacterium]|nr:hypothetical protein [Oscillospiraceae bacterium]